MTTKKLVKAVATAVLKIRGLTVEPRTSCPDPLRLVDNSVAFGIADRPMTILLLFEAFGV